MYHTIKDSTSTLDIKFSTLTCSILAVGDGDVVTEDAEDIVHSFIDLKEENHDQETSGVQGGGGREEKEDRIKNSSSFSRRHRQQRAGETFEE